ncbi:MAG: CDP-glucose 4,6-dehydratase [Lachnospiraceae bacterium]|nr:CDP-glucose 4,6-dehydratase [Lachnospiraceae bacterium]
MRDLSFYKGKKVFVTGHTGFKGSWMCQILKMAGAEVTGYSLEAPTNPALFTIGHLSNEMRSVIGDVRDLEHMKKIFTEVQPEIVIHMAAQPLVRESYLDPVYTYDVNVMGTVNILECIRQTPSVRSVVNVTTDKVYKNREWEWGYRENEELNGYDPYSNSKSCSELVTESYKCSFFWERSIATSTMRAGNVLGGGDFAADRIIPDCIRAAYQKKKIKVRNPYSIRPYQHVLEAVMAYLMVAERQYEELAYAGNYNVGPDERDCVTTGEIVTMFCEIWKDISGEKIEWADKCEERAPHEANFLKLDCSRLKQTFGWKPAWNIRKVLEKTIEWAITYKEEKDILECMQGQIKEYLQKIEWKV